MAADYIYEKPPLVEVIAEVYWKLMALAALPGASVDPYFDTTRAGFRPFVQQHGFERVQRVVPNGVPPELLSGQPMFRYRPTGKEWPVYQLGPGVLTANIVPPYGGWNAFRKTVGTGVEGLFASFPVPERQFSTSVVRLRYINAFDDAFGFQTQVSAYLAAKLGLSVSVPDAVLKRLNASPEQIVPALELSIPSANDSEAVIKITRGEKNKRPAVLLELVVQQVRNPPANNAEAIRKWFDDAHNTLHDVFELLATKELKDAMGKKTPVGQ